MIRAGHQIVELSYTLHKFARKQVHFSVMVLNMTNQF